MAILSYTITGDNAGLISATNQAILNIGKLTDGVNTANASLQFSGGIAALDTLGKALLVVNGNASLFGDSVKLQTQALNAYQTALNTLLANGFDPMNGDVTRLKDNIDELTTSLNSIKNVKVPSSVINDTSSGVSQENVQNPNIANVSGQSELVTALNAQLAAGTISAQEYNQALQAANSTANTLAASTLQTSEAIESQEGFIQGLKQSLSELNTQRLNAPYEDLVILNAEIQQTEIAIQQASNIGKVGFDQFGNSIKGVQLGNVNGQLIALSNNLFGARQIAKDVVRTFDAGSLSGFAKAVGLLAVDFLYYAQNAQFAAGATATATTAIATEGSVAATSGISTVALGAAFASLLTPVNLIILAVAVLGGGLLAYEKSQKSATTAAQDHLKALQDQKTALTAYLSTLTSSQQVEAASSDNYAEATIKLNELVFAVQNNTGALFDGKTALEDLQQLYPAFFANIDTAASKTDAFTLAAKDAGEALQALGRFTAANNLAQQSIQTSQQNQVALNATQAQQDKIKVQLSTAINTAAKTGNEAAADSAQELGKQFVDNSQKIKQYTDAILQANQQTKAFFDIANQNAPKAGLVSIKPDKGTSDIASNFDSLNEQLNSLLQKNSQLAGDNSGLSGYSKQIADITKQYTQLNDQVAKFLIEVNKSVANGSLTKSQGITLTNQGNNVLSQLPDNEDKAVNQAKIQDAQNTADAITKINNDFGIKEQAGYNQELSRTKLLYDNIIQANQQKANSLSTIDTNYQAAAIAAGGNQTALKAAKLVYDAEIQDAQDASSKIAAANADLLPAIQAIDAKYIQQEQETYDKIIDIANQAFELLDDGESARTDKINSEYQKRLGSANAYFDKLRTLAIGSNVPQSAIDSINNIQSQVNNVLSASQFKQVSEEISKNFAGAMQSAVQGLVSNTFSSITSLGANTQAINAKYNEQIANASDQATINQINNIRKLELASTTSFGAIFSDLISKFSSSFNQSILQSFTKQFTENLGKTLITPTAAQLTISPEQQSAQQVGILLKNAGASLADQIKQAGIDFYNSIHGGSTASGLTNLLSGASGGSTASSFNTGGLIQGGLDSEGVATAGDGFATTVDNSSSLLSDTFQSSANVTTSAANTAAATTTSAATHLSTKIAGAAAALSLAGGLISGATSPTSTVGQGIGGALQGAGEGALIGTAIAPGVGTAVGAVAGGLIGLVSGIFSANKAQKALQEQQLEQAQEQTAALKASLAYTSSIIGRLTANGVVTGVQVGSLGQLTATISGKDLQFVLDRNQNGR